LSHRKAVLEKPGVRRMRRLVTAGFSNGVIYKILRQWDVPDEALRRWRMWKRSQGKSRAGRLE
jgi:hypothetical protein